MSNKIEEKELEQIKSYEQRLTSIKLELGQIEINKDLLKSGFTTLLEEYNNLRKELEDKYGKVNINVSDGSFEEIKENEQNS